MKILMVCLGNICRSTLAEGILKSKVNTQKVIVDSAGTADYHFGESPDERAIAIAKENGIDISQQHSRNFIVTDFDNFDIIYVMDKSNYSTILSLARNNEDKQKVKLILNELYPQKDRDVPDPYYEGDKGFVLVYKILNKVCDVIALNIEKHYV